MANATVGALRVTLGLDSGAFTDGLNAAQKHLKGVGSSMQKVGATMATVGAGMTAAITAPLIAAGFAASRAAAEAADAMAQVEAALTSMGDGAGRTKEQLADLASGIMRNSLYDDDDILRKVTANLLTFGNVAGEQFDRAQVAAADLATRMGGDLQSATLMIGKALNDPAKGLSALRRVGIQFTAQQEAQIKAMAKAGDAAGAQRIMLSELERQFGGSAAAAAKTDPYDKLRDALNDLSESAGGIINRFLLPMATALAGLFDRFNGLSPAMQQFALVGAVVAAALGPVLIVVGGVVSAVGTLTAALAGAGIAAAFAAALPIIAAVAAAVAVAVAAFLLFKDDVQPVLAAFWDALQTTLGPALGELFAALGETVGQIAALFKQFFASEAGQALTQFAAVVSTVIGTTVIQILTALVKIVTTAVRAIGDGFKVLGLLLKGDFVGAWNVYQAGTSRAVHGIKGALGGLAGYAIEAVRKMVLGVATWLTGKLFDVLKGVISKVKAVSDAFFNLYDAVVGHSYIPDMVEGVAAWMAKLDAGMVAPAKSATDATKATFESLRDDVSAIMESLLTDTERAARDLAAKTKTIQDAMKAGQLTAGQGVRAEAGVAGLGLSMPSFDPVSPFENELPKVIVGPKVNVAFEDAAARFGDEFSYHMERVLNGDIKGVLADLASDFLRSSLSNAGAGLFKSGGGSGGFGNILKSAMSASGGGKLPGFKTGGSFTVGGSGGLDSQTVAFRATPGEMVDVRRPGQNAGGGVVVHFNPVINAQGAGPREVDVLRAELARMQREMPGTIVKTVADAQQRRALG